MERLELAQAIRRARARLAEVARETLTLQAAGILPRGAEYFNGFGEARRLCTLYKKGAEAQRERRRLYEGAFRQPPL